MPLWWSTNLRLKNLICTIHLHIDGIFIANMKKSGGSDWLVETNIYIIWIFFNLKIKINKCAHIYEATVPNIGKYKLWNFLKTTKKKKIVNSKKLSLITILLTLVLDKYIHFSNHKWDSFPYLSLSLSLFSPSFSLPRFVFNFFWLSASLYFQ